jgi:SAM-dependent methyltransferase
MNRDNPWLGIPAADYEAHMSAVGQSAVLRAIFSGLYLERRPRRLAVLGCTTGRDLELVDPTTTERAVGIDVNGAYLAIARQRLAALGPRLTLIEADLLEVTLPPGELDLVHAALVVEYVDPLALLSRVHLWLAPGGVCSVVTQQLSPEVPAISDTGYASLRTLAGHMRLHDVASITTLARRCGLRLLRHAATRVRGKDLVSFVFER